MLRTHLRAAPAALALAACFHDAAPALTTDGPASTSSTSTTAELPGSTSSTSTSTTGSPDPTSTGPEPGTSTGDATCPMGQPMIPWYADGDGDGHGAGEPVAVACDAPPGAVDNADDCDDALLDVHPGADELCNGLRDDDCDGLRDEYSPANVECGPCGLAEHDGATYWACLGAGAFLPAEADCQTRGATVHLANLADDAERQFVRGLAVARLPPMTTTLHFWVGLRLTDALWTDCKGHPEPAAWLALDGQPVTYLAWRTGEPNNYSCDPLCKPKSVADPSCPSEMCVELADAAQALYNDQPCYTAMAGHVCKAPL